MRLRWRTHRRLQCRAFSWVTQAGRRDSWSTNWRSIAGTPSLPRKNLCSRRILAISGVSSCHRANIGRPLTGRNQGSETYLFLKHLNRCSSMVVSRFVQEGSLEKTMHRPLSPLPSTRDIVTRGNWKPILGKAMLSARTSSLIRTELGISVIQVLHHCHKVL